MNENAYITVSQLNLCIKEALNVSFPTGVWVCGEIQGYNRNRDKSHVFFELCEKDPISKDILARIGLVIFSGRKMFIEEALKRAENAFSLKDDIEVKFFCKIDFYPPHGAVRLIVEQIDPTYTLGKIAQEKQRLIALLKQKGTLDKNKQLPLPTVPLSIGLITSHDSAAYNDFISELQISAYGFKVFCRYTLMQGKGAALDVCRAIDELESISNLDVIVITRGGGSIADLSCFDSEHIAQRIALCRLPVLSGIGHEINITITDLAAHTYQKTPTAIAQFITGRIKIFLEEVKDKTRSILEIAQDRLLEENRRLKNSALVIQDGTRDLLHQHHLHLFQKQEQLKTAPFSLLKNAATRLKHMHQLLELASPQNTLKRGFSITRLADGTLLRSARQAKSGTAIVTDLADGKIKSEVQK